MSIIDELLHKAIVIDGVDMLLVSYDPHTDCFQYTSPTSQGRISGKQENQRLRELVDKCELYIGTITPPRRDKQVELLAELLSHRLARLKKGEK